MEKVLGCESGVHPKGVEMGGRPFLASLLEYKSAAVTNLMH